MFRSREEGSRTDGSFKKKNIGKKGWDFFVVVVNYSQQKEYEFPKRNRTWRQNMRLKIVKRS